MAYAAKPPMTVQREWMSGKSRTMAHRGRPRTLSRYALAATMPTFCSVSSSLPALSSDMPPATQKRRVSCVGRLVGTYQGASVYVPWKGEAGSA